MEHHLFVAAVLMRTTVRFSRKSPLNFGVLLRTTVRFSLRTYFVEQPSVPRAQFPAMPVCNAPFSNQVHMLRCSRSLVTVSGTCPLNVILSGGCGTVLIGYCDYHPVTKLPKIGCCDYFSNVPNVLLLSPCDYFLAVSRGSHNIR